MLSETLSVIGLTCQQTQVLSETLSVSGLTCQQIHVLSETLSVSGLTCQQTHVNTLHWCVTLLQVCCSSREYSGLRVILEAANVFTSVVS